LKRVKEKFKIFVSGVGDLLISSVLPTKLANFSVITA